MAHYLSDSACVADQMLPWLPKRTAPSPGNVCHCRPSVRLSVRRTAIPRKIYIISLLFYRSASVPAALDSSTNVRSVLQIEITFFRSAPHHYSTAARRLPQPSPPLERSCMAPLGGPTPTEADDQMVDDERRAPSAIRLLYISVGEYRVSRNNQRERERERCGGLLRPRCDGAPL